jgi:hypothetical protein
MVIGLFQSAADAAMCLDNLAEADFGPQTVSLIMKTRQDVEAIANVSGPWTGLSVDKLPTKLVSLGLSTQSAAEYEQGVLAGGVFIAISAGEAEDAAAEMLSDARARAIRQIKSV